MTNDVIRNIVKSVYRRVMSYRLPLSFTKEDVFQQLYLYALEWSCKIDCSRSYAEQVSYLKKCIFYSAMNKLYLHSQNVGKTQGDNKGADFILFQEDLIDRLYYKDTSFQTIDNIDLVKHLFNKVSKHVKKNTLKATRLYFIDGKTFTEVGKILKTSPQNAFYLVNKFVAIAKLYDKDNNT